MRSEKGFIALASVLVLSAVFLSIGVGVVSRAISGSRMSEDAARRDRARLAAETCVEFALLELLRSLHYAGNERILTGTDTCDIGTISGVGNTDRIILVEGNALDSVYRMEVVVGEVGPDMTVVSSRQILHF